MRIDALQGNSLAIVDMYEQILQESITEAQKEDFLLNFSERRLTEAIKALEAYRLMDQKLKSWETIFAVWINKEHSSQKYMLLHNIRYNLRQLRTGVLCGFHSSKAGLFVQDGFYKPSKDKMGEFRLYAVKNLIFDESKNLSGLDLGSFKISTEDFLKDIRVVMTLKI